MVEAIAVDKDKARVAFETEVRRGGKAALVEVVKGNSFKTRIYPIPPNQITMIKVQYTADVQLTETGAGEFVFPIKTEQVLPLLKLRIEVREPKPPKITGKLKVKDFSQQEKEVFVVIECDILQFSDRRRYQRNFHGRQSHHFAQSNSTMHYLFWSSRN